MYSDPSCIICEDPVDIWSRETVTDAYQKDGINYYQFECARCECTQTHKIPLEDEVSVMTLDSLMTAFGVLFKGK